MTTGTLPRITSGIAGLDRVLQGGFIAGRAYMLRGEAGTGKTLVGVHFLTADPGDTALYVSFEESERSVTENAAQVGFDLDDVSFLDLSPDAAAFFESGYDLFAPDEVEGPSVVEAVATAIDEVQPDRVFVDPLSAYRDLTPDDYQFRTEVLSMMRYLTDAGATVVFSTQPGASGVDTDLQYLADGTVELGSAEKGRTVAVTKFRGSDFQSGRHTLRITDDGIAVYPKLVPGDHGRAFVADPISSGVEELDALLHGGIERGTVTVISGPTGVGKTTTSTQFLAATAAGGDRAVAYLFEESEATFRHRSEAIGIPIEDLVNEGTLAVETVEPLDISPDEFAAMVREEVEERDAEVVLIDGIAGYRLSLRGDDEDVVSELHALSRYLKNMGVTTVLVEETSAVTGDFQATERNISYLADNVVFLRYMEVGGEIRKAIGVLKKRAGDFERTLREFEITTEGIRLGSPLTGLQGILTGTPDLQHTPDTDD